jgi:arylsulfatase A-like enzyme
VVERLKRALPIDGWSLAILVWTLAFGVVLRAWRIVDFLWGTDDWSDLQWLPKSVGVDIGFALLVWVVCGVLLWPTSDSTSRAKRWVARTWSLVVLAIVMFFGVANALSFHVSGSALTLHRLRGDDGATTRDMDKFAWGDVWPILLLALASIVTLALVLAYAERAEKLPHDRRRHVALVVLLAGLVSLGAYELFWSGRDRGYGRHPVGVFVESVVQAYGSRPERIANFVAPPQSERGWDRLFTPDRPMTPPPPTPTIGDGAVGADALAAKNVIVFFSEGVPYKHTSMAPKGPDSTPRLKARAAKEGLEMTRFYSPFHKSIQAIFSLFCGDFPTPNGKSISELNPRIDCGEMSELMKKNGVHAGLFHGGYFSFYDKTAFLGDRGFEKMMDTADLRVHAPKRADGKPYEENSWGIDDRATVRALLAWIDTLPKEDRFASVLIPITAHYPYKVPSDVEKPFGDNRKIDRFWDAVHFLDIVFDELMQGLEQRGLLDDTLVIFLADHGESPHEPPRETNVDRAMYEYDVRVPFLMFNRTLFPTAQKSDRLASIADILPTVLDAMNIADVRERQGRSFLADDWHERRVFFGAARSNQTQVGFMDGTRKFIFDLGLGRTELYDLASDPDELRDLSRTEKDTVARYSDIALTYSKWQYARVRDWPTIGDVVNAQQRLGEDFRVTVTNKAGKRAECTTSPDDPTARVCAGFPPDTIGGVKPMRILGRTRSCMDLKMPDGGGTLEFYVEDREYFRFVTNMRMAFGPGRKETEGTAWFKIEVDDQPVPEMKLTKNWKNRRVSFGAPKKFFKITVTAEEDIRPAHICLFFGDAAWRPRLMKESANEKLEENTKEKDGDDGHDDLPEDAADPPVR